jgi:hypothetical protein
LGAAGNTRLGGEQHNGRRAWLRAQPGQYLPAIELGQCYIEQNERRSLVPYSVERSLSVGHLAHAIAFGLQQRLNQSRKRWIVFHDQNCLSYELLHAAVEPWWG